MARRSKSGGAKPRVGLFLTVRMKSTRLPLKPLRLIEGRTMLEHTVERLKLAKTPDFLVLSTSTNPQDDVLEDMARRLGIGCFRGSEDDVLVRLRDAAAVHGADFVIDATGDNPFMDPVHMDMMVNEWLENGGDYLRYQGLPLGTNPYGMTLDSLRLVCDVKGESQTEIWGMFFTQNKQIKSRMLQAKGPAVAPGLRMTVDTPEDLALVRAVFAELYEPGKVIPLDKAVALIQKRKDIRAINSHIVQKGRDSIALRDAGTGFAIGKRKVGPGEPVFVIAEAGVNHNGSLATAKRLVDAAAKAGADAVKFQTFKSAKLVTRNAARAKYQKRSGKGSQLEMLRRLELSDADHHALLAHCRKRRIEFLSTPFDFDSADLLEGLGVPAFKVSSGDLTNTPFLEHLARKGRPLILSTGMATLEEVSIAVNAVKQARPVPVALLHCTSAYPAPKREINLAAIKTLAQEFQVPIGYSDHTEGLEASVLAVGAGACIIEKHFTLDRTMEGPDHKASIEPGELDELVKLVKHARGMMGSGAKKPSASEADVARAARKSIVAARKIAKGRKIAMADLAFKRPGTGIPPYKVERVLGRKARKAFPEDAVIEEAWLEG